MWRLKENFQSSSDVINSFQLNNSPFFLYLSLFYKNAEVHYEMYLDIVKLYTQSFSLCCDLCLSLRSTLILAASDRFVRISNFTAEYSEFCQEVLCMQ